MEISDVIAEDNAAKLFECANTFAEFSKDESRDVLTFYEAESQVLTLYDHLHDLKLELALLEAQHRVTPSE